MSLTSIFRVVSPHKIMCAPSGSKEEVKVYEKSSFKSVSIFVSCHNDQYLLCECLLQTLLSPYVTYLHQHPPGMLPLLRSAVKIAREPQQS